ncbi:DUF3168 domain-containing protein [Limoniibacter endophyticus]|uniref:DUF3168 domain-containing protein n=1 Tax=Limoniibacter endophyticus TaxID=1565040 RepID=A0A8J3GHJ2_9HYPH|nr:DUF3168 domain-containing protein [Limoniibacter endophyticus]GHC66649.1 hypothetical protein GCM10010136_09900 [Limoniibacter endophyticus]
MSEPSLSAQKLLVDTLRARPALTALVPAANIFDRNTLPEVFPCIIIGEGQTVGDDNECMSLSEVNMTLHVWTTEPGMALCKMIAGEIRRAVKNLSALVDGIALDAFFQDTNFMRGKTGDNAHGVVTIKFLADDTVAI